MVGEYNDTCGEGEHHWIYENEEVHCSECEAVAIDCTIEPDGYVSDGEWCFDWHITVDTHTHQLADALKTARENVALEMASVPLWTEEVVLIEITDDEQGTTWTIYEA